MVNEQTSGGFEDSAQVTKNIIRLLGNGKYLEYPGPKGTYSQYSPEVLSELQKLGIRPPKNGFDRDEAHEPADFLTKVIRGINNPEDMQEAA